MPRVNVSSRILDESAVIPTQEGPSSFVLGYVDFDLYPNNLLGSLGFTHERDQGFMKIESVGDLNRRMTTNEPTGYEYLYTNSDKAQLADKPFVNEFETDLYGAGNSFAGGTFERWPSGPSNNIWNYDWNIIENYLQYGGQIIVFSPKESEFNPASAIARAKDKTQSVDAFMSQYWTKNDDIRSIVDYRRDCIAITSVPSEFKGGLGFGRFGPQIPTGEPAEFFDQYAGRTWGFGTGDTFGYNEEQQDLDFNIKGFPFNVPFVKNTGPDALVSGFGGSDVKRTQEPIFSVFYRNDIPLGSSFLGGVCAERIVDFELHNSSLLRSEESVGIRGWTADIKEAVTNGLLAASTNRNLQDGITYFNVATVGAAGLRSSVVGKAHLFGTSEIFDQGFPDQYVPLSGNPGVYSADPVYTQFRTDPNTPGGITFGRSSFGTDIGRIMIRHTLMPAYNWGWFKNRGPLEAGTPDFSFLSIAKPAGWNRGASASGSGYGSYAHGGTFAPSRTVGPFVNFGFAPQAFSVGINSVFTQQSGATFGPSQALGGLDSNLTFYPGLDDITRNENENIVSGFGDRAGSSNEVTLIDFTASLDPTLDPLETIFGTGGTNPDLEVYEAVTQDSNSPTYRDAVNAFKRSINIFGGGTLAAEGPVGTPAIPNNTGLNLNVSGLSDAQLTKYWGCTCALIPEFISEMGFIGGTSDENPRGLTPDICIETWSAGSVEKVGKPHGSGHLSITGEGCTYRAFIGFSNPTPEVTIPTLRNIYGEYIGHLDEVATNNFGTTASIMIKDSFNNAGNNPSATTIQGVEHPAGMFKTMKIFPLTGDASGEGTGLTHDESNYFYTLIFGNSSIRDRTSLGHINNSYLKTDVNFPLEEDAFMYDPVAKLGAATNQSEISPDSPIRYYYERDGFTGNQTSGHIDLQGATLGPLLGTVGHVGKISESHMRQFFGTGEHHDGWNNEGIYLLARVAFENGHDPKAGALNPDAQAFNYTDFTYDNIFKTNADLYEFPVFGEKFSNNSYIDYKLKENRDEVLGSNEIPFTSDTAGMFARLFRDLQPWFSPANQRVSSVNDLISQRYETSIEEQNDLYDNKINFIKQIDSATRLFGDKTFADATSTFSRINVANLFIYLKKKLEPLGRRFLFEQNDARSRQLFLSAAEPFLQTLQSQRAITDFRVVCDETNNTPDIVDSNQFVVDIFIKPVKTINFIKLTLNNVGTSFELE